ncbi:hypothetical protein JNL27_11775 [bacterium]|nr:hypothetical protein [bacterium]
MLRLSVLLVLISLSAAYAQERNYEIRFAVGYNTISPSALRSYTKQSVRFYEYYKITIPSQRNYPGNIAFSGAVFKRFSKFKVGLEAEYFRTQGRSAYADYAGSVVINGVLRSMVYNILLEYDIISMPVGKLAAGGFIGINEKKWKFTDHIHAANGELRNYPTWINGHITDFQYGSYMKIQHDLNRFGIGLSAGYRFDEDSPFSGNYIGPHGRGPLKYYAGATEKLRATASGWFFRLSASIRI